MLLAAALGDQSRFDAIWSWTQAHMRGADGLLAFHWVNGRVVDPTPASDADQDAARALLVASCRFGRSDLRQEAVGIGRAILDHETGRAGSLKILIAGPWAHQGSALVFNSSYVDRTTLGALAAASGDPQFRTVATDSTRTVDQLTKPLPPDWARVSQSGQATPVSGASATSGPGMFTYDAPRTPVRFAVDPDAAGRTAVARAWSVFQNTKPQDIVTQHQLSGAAVGTRPDDPRGGGRRRAGRG
jgi:endoglucanase